MNDCAPEYGQVYFMDTEESIGYRLTHPHNLTQQKRHQALKRELLEKTIRDHNPFAKSFELMPENYRAILTPPLNMVRPARHQDSSMREGAPSTIEHGPKNRAVRLPVWNLWLARRPKWNPQATDVRSLSTGIPTLLRHARADSLTYDAQQRLQPAIPSRSCPSAPQPAPLWREIVPAVLRRHVDPY
uniref:Uncharacterized protein n=1 Tax=Acrobeloides nanus TaxID=290746 RepID=A0A914BW06_9BILA